MPGVVDLFADMAAEGARGILGLYLAGLGASGLVVGAVTGFGELLGTALPFVFGRWSGRRLSGPITRVGAVVQMAAVPALALVGTWPHAAVLILAERAGRATRASPRNAGRAGAVIGPLAVAAILFVWRDSHVAFGALAGPALVTLVLVFTRRTTDPNAGRIVATIETGADRNYPPAFWWHLGAASLIAFGFANYSLISYHLAKAAVVQHPWIPLFYALALAAGGLGARAFRALFDRHGVPALILLTVVVAAYAPLAFSTNAALALAGTLLWGTGLGAHESVMRAAVARMVPPPRLGSAHGLFGAAIGMAWCLGSVVLGALYDVSSIACAAVAATAQLLAVLPLAVAACRRRR